MVFNTPKAGTLSCVTSPIQKDKIKIIILSILHILVTSYKFSNLENYTSNNTRQHNTNTTRDNTTQHELSTTEHEETWVKNTSTTRCNTSKTLGNTREHKYNMRQHEYNTTQNEYNTTQYEYIGSSGSKNKALLCTFCFWAYIFLISFRNS